tara:strand:+ start:12952 stop:13992 length:1041 start_codon:yes stop_codon:yes gene_type:complete
MTNQRDYIVENLSGSQFRSELNNILGDIQTNNSGSSAPTTTVAYKTWVDTANNKLKLRNGSNNGWITLGSLSTNLGLAPTADPNFSGKSITLPAGNDANRPTGGDLSQGDFRLNTQGGGNNNFLEFYSGGAWLALTTGAKFEVFENTSSSATFTPEAGRDTFLVICTGAGGGAGGVTAHGGGYWGSSGGGGGGTAIRFYNKTEMGTSATCVVGAGGAGSPAATGNGQTGSISRFTPGGTGLVITGEGGVGSSVGYVTTAATDMSRPGWAGLAQNGQLNCHGEKAEFQTINNYTGTTATGFNLVDMRSSGGGTFWGKGPGKGADGVWSTTSATGSAGTKGIIVVLSW